MPAGRPAKSDDEKQLEGTFRRDRQQAVATGKQSVTLLAQIPDPPAGLDERAQYAWHHVCDELFNLGMLRPIMLDWIEIYCLELADYFRFREQAEDQEWITQFQDEFGNVKSEEVSKYAKLAERAFNKAQNTLKLLCLDPATVKKLSPPGQEKKQSRLRGLIDANK